MIYPKYYVEIASERYLLTCAPGGKNPDTSWDYRHSIEYRILGITSQEAATLFVNDVVHKQVIVNYVTDEAGEREEEVIRDRSEFSMAGKITDNRDGTIYVKMGMPTAAEIEQSRAIEAETALMDAYELLYGGM